MEPDDPLALLGFEQLRDLGPGAAGEPRHLGADLDVAPGQREQLEHQRHVAGVLTDHVLQRPDQRVDEVVGGVGVREGLVQERDPQLGVSADHLDQQALLGAEVVVQQAA